MIEVFDFAQGSAEWFAARLGIPTASCFADILAKGQGKTRRSYMMKLIGEIMTGEPSENFSNGHMERGKEMEPDARNLYAFHLDVEPVQVGFIRNGRKGCSPDSLVGSNGMSEIKTKLPHLQVEVLLADRLPPEHIPQCQGNLWVAEREWIDFVSYWPKMPLFVKRVYRDEIYIKNLAAEVDLFLAELDTYLATLRNEPLRVTA
jgi:YqaJ-like viral recombinase domain